MWTSVKDEAGLLKLVIRRNFARRAASYDRHARIQKYMAAELLRLLGDALKGARRILEVGCGSGTFTALLCQHNPRALIVALDLDLALLQVARARLAAADRVALVVADGEVFAGGPYDLIVGNSVFQWFTRPQETLRNYCGSLREGGVLAFSTLGPATFRELAASFRLAARRAAAGEVPEIVAQSFCGEETWKAMLHQAGFRQVALRREEHLELHPSVEDFLRSLQATGATNPRPRPLPPRLFREMVASYQQAFGRNGSIPVTYEILWVWARK